MNGIAVSGNFPYVEELTSELNQLNKTIETGCVNAIKGMGNLTNHDREALNVTEVGMSKVLMNAAMIVVGGMAKDKMNAMVMVKILFEEQFAEHFKELQRNIPLGEPHG